MNKKNKYIMGMVAFVLTITLMACGNRNQSKSMDNDPDSQITMKMDHSNIEHSGSSHVPKVLKAAKNPTYKVGSKVILEANHMEGMKGAKATIKGAYDTLAYVVSYIPTTGGEIVENHKWVIQEEIKNAGLKPGTKVVLEADHMEGMSGATAEIVSSEKTTVYMVDYTPTNGGDKVSNHKWVTEEEISPK